jgi:hypothetical protein
MKLGPARLHTLIFCLVLFASSVAPSMATGQTCQTSAEIEDPVKSVITTSGQRFFDMASKGDSASMRQNAIPSLAASFAGIEALVKDRQPDLAGAQVTLKSIFVLEEVGAAPNPHAEFLCGVFGKNGQTANSAAFYLDNLPPAKYAVVLFDTASPKGKTMFSEILQQVGTDWKLADLYIKPAGVAGHETDWFLDRARAFKAKGQNRNAWLYYVQGIDLVSRGLKFMGTLATDKLYDEAQSVQPADLPINGKTVDLAVGSTTYKLSAVYPWMIGDDLNLFVKYRVEDVSNSNLSYQNNVALAKALVAKYPEFRDAFPGVEALAIDTNGRDYGTLLAMKDIK